jgi:5-dehydro-2-deoxygluconokinase
MKQELFILPFDHRSSFLRDILNLSKKPNKKEKEGVEQLKNIIFEGFLSVVKKEKDKKKFGILVDEEYGEKILNKAYEEKVTICLPVEKSGKDELTLEYGKKFKEHVDKFKPDFVKILIRYNPLNSETNKKQLKVLYKINKLSKKYKIILELLVPPTENEKKIKNYDRKIRIERTIGAIEEIKKAIKVNIWKLEGFEKNQWKKVIDTIPKESKIIFLGRGQDKKKVVRWLKAAAPFKEIVGFAIGRTTFLETLKEYHKGKILKEKAIKIIANNFKNFIELWRKQKIKNLS